MTTTTKKQELSQLESELTTIVAAYEAGLPSDHVIVNGKRYGMVEGHPAKTRVFDAFMAGFNHARRTQI